MNDYLSSFLILIFAFFIGVSLYFVIRILLKRTLNISLLQNLSIKLDLLERPFLLLLPMLSIMIIFPLLSFPANIKVFISRLVDIALIISLCWMLLKIIQIIRNVVLSRHNIEIKDNIHVRTLHTQIQLLTNIISIIIIILTIALILLSFPEAKQVGITILASAGIIGVILGLTAQKTLGNLIAGIQIAISQPIRIDDVVVVENEWGRIEEITLTYVVVRIWDLRRLIVPIAYFVEKPFQNWTHRSDQLMGTVFFYVDYSLPVNELRNELTAILNKSKFWDKRVNDLSVTNLTEKTVELRAVVSAADSSTLWNLRCEVREKLWLFLQKNFIDNFPRVRIEMKPDNVNTQGSKLTSV